MPARRDAQRSRRLLRAVSLGVVIAATGVGSYACRMYWPHAASKPQAVVTSEPAQTPYKTEEDWLLTTIATDLVEMAVQAAPPPGSSLKVHPRISIHRDKEDQAWAKVEGLGRGPLDEQLRLEHSTWAPEDYESFAAHALAAADVTASAGAAVAEGHDLLGRLLDLRADVLQGENESLSDALRKQPANAELHGDAALLLGAFALREAAGSSTDIRRTLSRMTAHLAFARALGGPQGPGRTGQYAELLLAALAERGAEAQRLLDAFGPAEANDTAGAAWQRIVRMRLTDDWRVLDHPAQASLAERLAWLRAMDQTFGSPRQLDLLRQAKAGPGAEPDWYWLMLRRPSVGMGNMFADDALTATLAEVLRIYARVHGKPLPRAELVDALNSPAQPFVSNERPRVIAWGTWAAMYQRHLVHLFERTEYHYREHLGLKGEAERYAAYVTKEYSKLTFFPVLQACWEADQKENPAPAVLDAAVTFIQRHPELPTLGYWWGIEQKTEKQHLPRRLPGRASWFSTGCVRGTTYHAGLRRDGMPALTPLERLLAISPRDYAVAARALLESTDEHPTLAQAQAAFGERAQYDQRVLTFFANRVYLDMAEVVGFRHRLCELDPEECLSLGASCVDAHDEPCAIAAFEKGFREATDRVSASLNGRWLMEHYLRSGETERAQGLAEMCDDVGSYGGMLTMATFLERTGRYEEAERRIIDARTRYPDDAPDLGLIAFYHRMAHVRRVAGYERKFAKAATNVFPKGLEKIDVAALSTPPTDGVEFDQDSPVLSRSHLQRGDVVVGLNGWRVRTVDQLHAVRQFDDSPDFRLTVWHGARYLDVPCRRLYRSFGVEMSTYKPARAKAEVGAASERTTDLS